MYKIYSPKSFTEYLNIILEVQSNSKNTPLWFRGCDNCNHELKPSLYRHRKVNQIGKLVELEFNLLTRFRQRSIPFHDKNIDNDLNALFFMQHYGIPTRLLDWTENPFIAFFFAATTSKFKYVKNKIVFDNSACVWVLNPVEWNKHSLKDVSFDQGILTIADEQIKGYWPMQKFNTMNKLPVALYGAHNSQRIVSQRGVFTIFGENTKAMDKIYHEEKYPEKTLVKINLKKRWLYKMRNDILNNGITESVVYPDLEGLAKEIRRTYGFED